MQVGEMRLNRSNRQVDEMGAGQTKCVKAFKWHGLDVVKMGTLTQGRWRGNMAQTGRWVKCAPLSKPMQRGYIALTVK